MTSSDREDYTTALIDPAMVLVDAVHTGTLEQIAAAAAALYAVPVPTGVDQRVAVAVALAAMVTPGTSEKQRLGWLWQPPAGPAGSVSQDAVRLGVAGAITAGGLSPVERRMVAGILIKIKRVSVADAAAIMDAEEWEIRRWARLDSSVDRPAA